MERETDRETERDRERGKDCVWIFTAQRKENLGFLCQVKHQLSGGTRTMRKFNINSSRLPMLHQEKEVSHYPYIV